MYYDSTKIREARILRGWNQETLAKIAGLAPCTINRIEKGLFGKPPTIKKIADSLGIQMTDLFSKRRKSA